MPTALFILLRGWCVTWVPVALAVCLAASPAPADRLHLDSGGFIDVDSWWYEDQWVMYENDGGTVGIPRSIVVRVEKTPADKPAGPFPPSRSSVKTGQPSAARMAEIVKLANRMISEPEGFGSKGDARIREAPRG